MGEGQQPSDIRVDCKDSPNRAATLEASPSCSSLLLRVGTDGGEADDNALGGLMNLI